MKKKEVLKHLARLRQELEPLRRRRDCSRLEDFFFQHEGELLAADMLILKSAALQLSDNVEHYDLEDARKALLEALELRPRDNEARIDLAYFENHVMDRATDALPLFSASIKSCLFFLQEAIYGKAEVIEELYGLKAAIAFLRKSPLQTRRLKHLLEEFNGNLIELENMKAEHSGPTKTCGDGDPPHE
jgi:hypothetical protein